MFYDAVKKSQTVLWEWPLSHLTRTHVFVFGSGGGVWRFPWYFKKRSKSEKCREIICLWVGITGGTQHVTNQETNLESFQAGLKAFKPKLAYKAGQHSFYSRVRMNLNLSGIQMRNSLCRLGPKLITVLITGTAWEVHCRPTTHLKPNPKTKQHTQYCVDLWLTFLSIISG